MKQGDYKAQRIIEGAILNRQIGLVTADELLSMPDNDWRQIRGAITDHRNGNEEAGIEARCLSCGNPVCIESRANRSSNGTHLPFFQHFGNKAHSCISPRMKNMVAFPMSM